MEKSEIIIQSQQNKLTRLTSLNLLEKNKKYLQLWYGTKKVAKYESEELKNLFKFVLALCKLIGVTEPPEKEIIVLLIDHLQEHHKDFSTEEIRRAFSMATAGKLNFEFNHYNRLTPQLISRTLNAYKSIRSKEILSYEHKLSEEEEEADRKLNKPSEERIMLKNIEVTLDLYKRFSKNIELVKDVSKLSESVIDFGNLTFDFLKSINVIVLVNDTKEGILARAKAVLIKELRKSKTAKKIVTIISDDSSFEVQRMCRRIALMDYFNHVYCSKLDLEELIMEKLSDNQIYKNATQT